MNNKSYDIIIANTEIDNKKIKKICSSYTICLEEYKDIDVNYIKQDKLFKDILKLSNYIIRKKVKIKNEISNILALNLQVYGKDKLFLEQIIMSFMHDTISDKTMYDKLNNHLQQENSTIKKKLTRTIENIYDEGIFNQYGIGKKPRNKEFVDKVITSICNDIRKG